MSEQDHRARVAHFIEAVQITVLASCIASIGLPLGMHPLGLPLWISVLVWLTASVLLTLLMLIPSRQNWRVERWKHEGRCEACGYALTGLTVRRCPECGTKF